MKKKKHAGLKIFTGLIVIFLIAAAALAVHFYPVYRDAGLLEENLNFKYFSYELEAELNRDELEENQVRLLDTLVELTGLGQEAMYHLYIQGSVDGDIIHARIYPQGQREPLIELYLSDGVDVINGALLYNAVRTHYTSEKELLAYLVPVWDDHEFVSLDQMEQMLDVDLDEMKNFRLSFVEKKLSVKELFVALAAMEREKSGNQCSYTLTLDGVDAQLKLDYDTASVVNVRLAAEKPGQLLQAMSEKLSKFGISFSREKLYFLDDISITAAVGEGEELQVPEDLISQKTVEIITGIRLMIEQISEIQ